MSDFIPFDIQVEIIKRLPIKSVLRFRSVSKPWKSLIDSKKYINDHASNHKHPQHLLVRYDDHHCSETKYVSILDDDSFPQHKSPLIAPPQCLNLREGRRPNLVYSSHGLFCFYNFYDDYTPLRSSVVLEPTAVIWNPSIRKSVDIVVPNILKWPYKTVIGFGVCPRTLHFRLVKVSHIIYPFESSFNISSIPYQVEVYTSSSGGGWRSPLCINNLPRLHIVFNSDQVVIDGFIYWLAYDRTPFSSRQHDYHLIMSFDMASEEFTEIYFPNGLICPTTYYISKLNGSLVLFECMMGRKTSYDVWKMDNVTSKTFLKLYTIITPEASVERVLGFRNSGELIIQPQILSKDCSEKDSLFVYEYGSKHINNSIPISGSSFSVISYVETLLLLDY